jgi:hypothetical protein
MKRAAADLIWSASAKVSREERAEVIRRLPPLLKTLRDGMQSAGVPANKQDEHIQKLNNSLAAAFTAKAAAIPHDRPRDLMARLETLGRAAARRRRRRDRRVARCSTCRPRELRARGGRRGRLDAHAGHAVVGPRAAGGSWFMLDYRNRNEAVQLAWQGLRKQLTLFVSPQGRGILFQQHRLAAFLQAGPAGAGAGRIAHGACHAQRFGQAGRRSGPPAQLSTKKPPQGAFVVCGEALSG